MTIATLKTAAGVKTLGYLERYRSRVARLSIRVAAKRAGVAAGTWKDWETGRRPIPLSKVSAVEAALGMDDGSMKTGKLWEWRAQDVLESTLGQVNSRDAVADMVECSLNDYLDRVEGGPRDFTPHPGPVPRSAADLEIVTAEHEMPEE